MNKLVLRKSVIMVLFLMSLILNACATVTKGTSQSIVINTNPSGASCALTREGGTIAIVNPTPGTVMVEKDKDEISVLCKKNGFQDGEGILKSEFQAMTLGNILLGGIIGLGVDAVSGAMNQYQTMLILTLIPTEFDSSDEKDKYFDTMKTFYLEEYTKNYARLSSQCDLIDNNKESEKRDCQNQLTAAESAKEARLIEIEQKRQVAKLKNLDTDNTIH